MGLTANGDLPLLHGLEQSALNFGRGAIDFVGEDQIGENWALVSGEFSCLRLKDHRADDIARQEVGRELDALELDAQGRAERFYQESLGETGHALEQNVAISQK